MSRYRHVSRISPLNTGITRRDFVGGAIAGAGVALLNSPCPTASQALGPAWTGYGGVGDYRLSNGNTAAVVSSAHRIRDGAYQREPLEVIDTAEIYDVVIVGGGFAGISALYDFHKRKANGKCLLLDNHPIFGGFAKSNEFDVGGYRIAGPQASINFFLPAATDGPLHDNWHELGLPDQFQFARPESCDSTIVFPKSTSGPLYFGEQSATVGYFFQNAMTQGKGTWVKDIWNGDLQRAPWPESFKEDLRALRDRWPRLKHDERDAWLDRITFGDLVTKVMGLSPQVLSYVTPIMGIAGHSANVSAYAAANLVPGLDRFADGTSQANLAARWMSFPGGNATLLRHYVKALFPDAIAGPNRFEAIASNPMNLAALDLPEASCRMRMNSTAIRVRHEGDPKAADFVSVVYERKGRLYGVKARAAVLAIGSWAAKHIVSDLPAEYRAAQDGFMYEPVLMVNVALRNWRFLDKLGFGAARWFDGFGFFGTIRQPMLSGGSPAPFHPDKPIVMTLYVPIQNPELPLAAQGRVGRAQLYGTSYAEYERQIVSQMRRLFSSGGFDARRDIAGIVLNRWGHAMPMPAPGFFFGEGGKPPLREILRTRFGRIAFGHSELGRMNWSGATDEGKRAMEQSLT